jgi:hypothetical protein
LKRFEGKPTLIANPVRKSNIVVAEALRKTNTTCRSFRKFGLQNLKEN